MLPRLQNNECVVMSDKLKNFIVRTLSGAVLLLVILGALYIGYYGYLALLLLVTMVGVWEFYNLSKAKEYDPQRGWGLALSLFIYLTGAALGLNFADGSTNSLVLSAYMLCAVVLLVGAVGFYKRKQL